MATLQNPRVFSKVRNRVDKASSQKLLCVRRRSAMHFGATKNASHYWLRERGEWWGCATQRIFEQFAGRLLRARLFGCAAL
jgi:hypothetical protein